MRVRGLQGLGDHAPASALEQRGAMPGKPTTDERDPNRRDCRAGEHAGQRRDGGVADRQADQAADRAAGRRKEDQHRETPEVSPTLCHAHRRAEHRSGRDGRGDEQHAGYRPQVQESRDRRADASETESAHRGDDGRSPNHAQQSVARGGATRRHGLQGEHGNGSDEKQPEEGRQLSVVSRAHEMRGREQQRVTGNIRSRRRHRYRRSREGGLTPRDDRHATASPEPRHYCPAGKA